MRFNVSHSLAICAGLAAVASLTGCGGSSSISTPAPPIAPLTAHNYLGTQSPGDVWAWTLGPATFTAENSTRSTGYSGSSSLLASGFYKLTVAASTDSTVAVGSVAYALDVPGVAFVAQPAGTLNSPIVGAAVGMNPTGTTPCNWITIPHAGWNAATDEAYGTASLTMNSDTAGTVAISSNMIDGTLLRSHTQDVTCVGGQFSSGGSTGVVTPSGVIMLDNGPNQGGIVGVKAAATDVDLADLASKEYRGILFKNGPVDPTRGNSELLKVSSNGSGALDGVAFTDVEQNLLDDAHHVTLSFSSQPSPGLVRGVLTEHGNITQSFVFAISKIGGKYMIYGFAAEHDGTSDNFLLMEK